MELESQRNKCELQSSTRGQVWVTNLKEVEWMVGANCIRKYKFNERVLQAGFVNFENTEECLVIILEYRAHVYNLSKGDSTTVSFPFAVSNAFFYSNGVLLERSMVDNSLKSAQNPMKHRFITLSDPLTLFGSLVFSSSPSESESKLTMLHFPQNQHQSICALLDNSDKTLHFYNAKVLSNKRQASQMMPSSTSGLHEKKSYGPLSNEDNFASASNSKRRKTSLDMPSTTTASIGSAIHNPNPSNSLSTGLTNNLRKISIMNRRSVSANLAADHEQLQQPLVATNSGSEFVNRSASATLDRMRSGSALDISPSTTSQISQELFDQAVLAKDVVLTKITLTSVPHTISTNLKIISSRFGDKEAVVVYDKENDWGKIWIFNLNSSLVGNMKFKAFGYSPVSLTKTIDIKSGMINDICDYECPHLTGFVMLLLNSKCEVTLYNPFLNLTSDSFSLPLNCSFDCLFYASHESVIFAKHIKQIFIPTFPLMNSIQHYFTAIRYLCDPFTYHYIAMIWQVAKNCIKGSNAVSDLVAFKLTLLSFLPLEPDSQFFVDEIRLIRENPVYNSLYDMTSFLPKIVMGLHLIREEYKLNLLQTKNVELLGEILLTLTSLMGWPRLWQEFYFSGDLSTQDYVEPLNWNFAHPLDAPPSILRSLYSVTEESSIPLTPYITYSRLLDDSAAIDDLITPRTHKMLLLFESLQSEDDAEDKILTVMNTLSIDLDEFETYPLGIFAPLKRALQQTEEALSELNIDNDKLSLIDRSDLKKNLALLRSIRVNEQTSGDSTIMNEFTKIKNSSNDRGYDHQKPKNIKSMLTDILKYSKTHLSSESMPFNNEQEIGDGETLKRNAGLIFSDDRRFVDAIELLLYYIPHKVQLFVSESSYTKNLRKKRRYAQISALRTLNCGIGWGAVAFATERPLSTQKWPRPKMNLISVFPDDTTVSIDSESLDKELFSWGEFHAGVSSGLRISKKATGITGSWITFNKPQDLDAQHGGFLLGLGLNGHLKSLEEWHVYNYLSPKQTHTSIGLLLGMSASLRGTMDLKLTKVMSVHIVALLPPGSSDLNVNFKVQTAGLIGIGLLYQRSQHRRMSDMLFSELTSFVNINEEPVPDEGYRLAAGVALGLVNIGAGGKTLAAQNRENEWDQEGKYFESDDSAYSDFKANNGLMDPKIIEGLVGMVTKVNDIEEEWMPDNSHAGALVSLMIIFLKTNNKSVGDKIIPTPEELNITTKSYVRPELFMYREWAYYMIVWESIDSTMQWLLQGFDQQNPLELSTDSLPRYYCLAGRALALGIKFASTNEGQIRDNILSILDRLLPLYQCPVNKRLDFRLTIKGIDTLMNVLLVSASMIMCGSGDLSIFRRAKYLHEVVTGKYSDLFRSLSPKSKKSQDAEEDNMSVDSNEQPGNEALETDMNSNPEESEEEEDSNDDLQFINDENHYGKYMATSLALGFLFLGSGQYALKTSDLESISYLIISILPTYMTPYYLQETKHFWSLAAEPRSLVTKNAKTGASLNKVPIQITMKSSGVEHSTKIIQLTSPCLLPDVKRIHSIEVFSPDYYPLKIKLEDKSIANDFFKNGCVLYVQKKENSEDGVEVDKYNTDARLSDIKQAFRKKYQSRYARNSKNDNPDLAEELKKYLGFSEPEVLEFRNEILKGERSNNLSSSFNLDMACESGDKSIHLELWRRRHGL